MFRKRIKAVLKGVVREIRDQIEWWDQEENEERSRSRNFDQDPFVYPWLNSLLVKLLREKGNAFRPHFTWGMLQAAHLSSVLGIKRISVIEFGVAGGNGLVSLEEVAKGVEALMGVGIDVYGFDTGVGLPKPVDYRDLPNAYQESDFCMNVDKLKKRLSKAQLFLGHVETTITKFIDLRPAPVAFISFDLDYYTSTMQAFKLFEAVPAVLLPRIHCYFDDILGFTFSEFTGERLAISDFNHTHQMRKISPIYGLRYFLPPPCANEQWVEGIYLAHIFEHPLYGVNDGLSKSGKGDHFDVAALEESASSDEIAMKKEARIDRAGIGAGVGAEAVQKRRDCLDLTRDAMMVRSQDGTIRFWNTGAQQLYGWPQHEALGQSSHRLLKTIFPEPLDNIEAKLRARGSWEGQLVHRRRDGSQVIVASQWKLQHSTNESSGTVVEINQVS